MITLELTNDELATLRVCAQHELKSLEEYADRRGRNTLDVLPRIDMLTKLTKRMYELQFPKEAKE